MKMNPLLWRVVSLWLCFAVVCRYPSYYVGCTESHQEAQRPESPQDISEKEESGEKTHDKVEEILALPVQSSLPVNEQKQDYDQQKEEQMEVEEDKKGQESKVDEPTHEVESEGDSKNSNQEPEPEEASEMPNFAASITQDKEFAVTTTSPEPLFDFIAGDNDTPSILNVEDNIPGGVSDDASDSAVPEVTDSDLPPAECEEEEEEVNPYDSESSPPKVLENISNAHAAGTKTHTDPPLTPQADQNLEVKVSQILGDKDLGPHVTDTDPSQGGRDPEDNLTFDEWKKKMMEVEKEKTLSTHTSNNGGTHVVKKVQKNFNNYASVECGAKILGANPEAKSTSAILKENMDLYMLNPCSNKIWFIIELCEPIQLKQLDIANFELFSSTPKDFLVSISDRYPTNKWLKLGTFHARDERTVQSFPLDEHLYAKYVKMFTKYIKVELVSHFGSEHFCPLSLIRVFGTSMVEEYEEADPSERPDDPDDDLDYPPGYGHGEVKHSKNLIGSAKDVILNMVNNIAVNVLGGSQEMQGNLSSHEVNTTEPSAQLETLTEAPITDLATVPDSEEVEIPSDVDTPESGAPSSETVVLDPPVTSEETPSTEEAETITRIEKDEEEPIIPTVILLDKEEELDEEKGKKESKEHQQSVNYCALLPSFSSCSCSASLQEYLQRRCLAQLFKQRRCQSTNKGPATSTAETPAWPPPSPPSACPQPTQHHSEAHQPRGKEQASEQQPDAVAGPSEAPRPAGGATASEPHKEPVSEGPLLEPSQTPSFPSADATDSSAAKPTPIVQTPQLSSEEPAKQPKPEKSQDVPGEEKHTEALEPLTTSIYAKPSATVTREEAATTQTEEKPSADVTLPDIKVSAPTPDVTDQSPLLHPTSAPPHLEPHPDPPALPESSSTLLEPPQPVEETPPAPEPEPSMVQPEDPPAENPTAAASGTDGGQPHAPPPSPPSASLPAQPSLSDIYAEPLNGTEQNGNPVHGSSQKESVFMRLNNRIKALEMNMSLSGRYLEQLSQRYRKQMEEMQKAFNKTIIKLQNTSRIAEEQDQRQTESIQLLQGQLENVTQLVLNLSVRVSQLQNEVSDREHYLLLSLALCVCLGLALFSNCCRISTVAPAAEPETPFPKSYSYYCPDRQFSSGDETGLKRSASYPLIHSDSLQLATTEGPESLHAVETQSHFPAIRKRRRRKVKPIDKVETLTPSFHAAPELCNGAALCNGVPVTTKPMILTNRLLQPTFRDSPSEGSSEASSHSDDPSFCGITTACTRICDGLPPAKSRAEKRALRRRRLKPPCAVVDFLHAPRSDNNDSLPIATIEDIMNRKTEPRSGTYGVTAPLSGPVYLKE